MHDIWQFPLSLSQEPSEDFYGRDSSRGYSEAIRFAFGLIHGFYMFLLWSISDWIQEGEITTEGFSSPIWSLTCCWIFSKYVPVVASFLVWLRGFALELFSVGELWAVLKLQGNNLECCYYSWMLGNCSHNLPLVLPLMLFFQPFWKLTSPIIQSLRSLMLSLQEGFSDSFRNSAFDDLSPRDEEARQSLAELAALHRFESQLGVGGLVISCSTAHL